MKGRAMAEDRRLEDHFSYDTGTLGLKPAELPLNLFFTYCGDILGSSGEHYAKGKPITLEEAARIANTHYSDDFAESLAMHLLCDKRWKQDLRSLMAGRDEFLDIIRSHYIAYGLQYSPWAAALFEEKIVERYGVLLANHDSCGAAMRAAALAPHLAIDEENLLPFFLITHANVQSIEGAYIVWGFARAALAKKNYAMCMHQGFAEGARGRKLALRFLMENNLPHVKDVPVEQAAKKVLQTRDPYVNLTDIGQEGVDTHFVVTSSLLILDELSKGKAEEGREAAYVIERGLEIGGDPDTICSVTMGLAGLLSPREFYNQLKDVEIKVKS